MPVFIPTFVTVLLSYVSARFRNDGLSHLIQCYSIFLIEIIPFKSNLSLNLTLKIDGFEQDLQTIFDRSCGRVERERSRGLLMAAMRKRRRQQLVHDSFTTRSFLLPSRSRFFFHLFTTTYPPLSPPPSAPRRRPGCAYPANAI